MLKSLLDQTQKSDIVIATSTPNDHIEGEAKRHGVRVVANQTHTDIAGDWNFALSIAPARFATLAHQDDWYAPEFASESTAMLSSGESPLGFTAYREINDDGRPVHSKISLVKHAIESSILGNRREVSGWRLRAFLSFGNPLPCSSVTYDLKRLEGFSFSNEFTSNLDWDAWWRLMKSGESFARSPRRLVGRRHNELTETSSLIASGVRQQEDRAMFRRAWPQPLSEFIAFAYRAGYH
jgi:hypothetical protein